MGLFGKKTSELEKRRTNALQNLKGALERQDSRAIYDSFFRLSEEQGKLLETPDMPYILTGAIEAVARRDLLEGLHLSTYALNIMHNHEVADALSERALQLIARTDKNDMKHMSSVAMLSGLIIDRAPDNSDTEKRGMKAWHDAADALAAKKEGLQFAFAAASNAALGIAQKDRLKREALDFWEKTVTSTMKTDFNAAKEEATRVANQYADFGYDGHVFRKRARDMLQKMQS